LNTTVAKSIFIEAETISDFASILGTITLVQIFAIIFLVIVIFVPFFKVYMMGKSNSVHKKGFQNDIREGDHLLLITIRKLINNLVNVIQLSLIIYVSWGSRDVIDATDRISSMGCSDEIVN